MSEIKEKTINGLAWSFVDSMSGQVITFIVGIILARLLGPREFGLIGMTAIFIAVSENFISSGFGPALVRKKVCTNTDYSTVFYFNLTAGIVFFLLLYLTAPFISKFYDEPQLKAVIRVLAFVLIIGSLSIIQQTVLIRNVNFRLQAKISIVSGLFSGLISIWMAFRGFGVWSLVAKTLIQRAVTSSLLWYWNRWIPSREFSRKSFNELFRFGYGILLGSLLDTIYRNIYLLIIGKFFSATDLGYYTRADRFKALPVENINNMVSRVTYPVLASIRDDRKKLKSGYKRLLKSTMLLSSALMFFMTASARYIIIALVGEKWVPSIVYLQLLSLAGMIYPLGSLNMNMLLVEGRSDLTLKLGIVYKILAVPVIIAGIFWGIKIMITGMVFTSLIGYIITSFYSGKFINYRIKEQFTDIFPSFIVGFITGLVVFIAGILIDFNPYVVLGLQIATAIVIFVTVCESFKLDEYFYLKNIVVEKISNIKYGR